MLRQMLQSLASQSSSALTPASVPEWEETLYRLSLSLAHSFSFPDDDQHKSLVKIKKIPGGRPKDSEFVDGAVITKNLAHKSMLRSTSSSSSHAIVEKKDPRIMFLRFPLDFTRVEGKYIPFGQLLSQESEWIDNLIGRIASFRPHIVLCEKGVGRLALERMEKMGIGVARGVKASAVSFVARCTGGDVVSGVETLALEPRLGTCRKFTVRGYKAGEGRKSYLWFDGCGEGAGGAGGGCTIVLRGGSEAVLRDVKRVARFAIFVVRNLKMESSLWRGQSESSFPCLY